MTEEQRKKYACFPHNYNDLNLLCEQVDNHNRYSDIRPFKVNDVLNKHIASYVPVSYLSDKLSDKTKVDELTAWNADLDTSINCGQYDMTNPSKLPYNLNNYQIQQGDFILSEAPIITEDSSQKILDFWEIVVDSGIDIIVMLTDFVEYVKDEKTDMYKKSIKADIYFQLSDKDIRKEYDIKSFTAACKTHNIVFTDVTTDDLNDNITIYTYTVTLPNRNPHLITHIWFKKWPDKKAIDTTVFINLLQTYASKLKPTSKTLVHCSAGVGRTGTFVTGFLASIYPNIPIDCIILFLRRCRILQVQTDTQYESLLMLDKNRAPISIVISNTINRSARSSAQPAAAAAGTPLTSSSPTSSSATSPPTSSSAVPPSAIPSIEAPLLSSQAPAPASAEPLPIGLKVKYKTNPGKEFVVEGHNTTNPHKIRIKDPTDEKEDFIVDISDLIPVSIPASSSTSSTLTAATSGTSVPEPVLGTAQGSTSTNPIVTMTTSPTSLTTTVTEPCIGKLFTSPNDDFIMSFTDDKLNTDNPNRTVYIQITKADDGYRVEYTGNDSVDTKLFGAKVQGPLLDTSHVPLIIPNIKYNQLVKNTTTYLEQIYKAQTSKRKSEVKAQYKLDIVGYTSEEVKNVLEYVKKERIAKIKEEQRIQKEKKSAAKAVDIPSKKIKNIDVYLNDFGIIGIWDSINSTLNDICKDLSKIGRIDTDPPKFFGKNRQQYSRYIDEIAPYITSLNTKGTIYNQCQKILTESKDKQNTIDNLKELSKILHELFMILNTFKETYSDNSLTLKINNDALKSTLTHLKESNNSNNNTFLKNMITEIMQDQRPTEIIHKDNIEVIHIQKFLEKYLTIIITKIDAYFKVEDTKITKYIEKQLKFAQQKNAHTKSKLINYLKRVNPTTQSNINEVDGNIKWLNNPSNHTYNELRKKLKHYMEKYPMPEKVAVSSVDKQVA